LDIFRNPNNRLFRLARQGRRLTRWWAVPLLLLLFTLAGAPGFLIPLESAEESGLWRSALETAAFFVASYLPVAVLIVLWVWRREGRGIGSLGLGRESALRYILMGFAFGIGLVGLGVILIATSGDASLSFEQTDTTGWIAIAPALVVLAGWAVQGTTEEMMFRGWLLQVTGVQLGPLIGAVVTTGYFALLHLGNPGITALSVVNLVLVGVLFTLIALLEGGIWAASAFHVSWNWAQSNIFGFKVSGLEIGGGSVFRVVPDGSDSILGGEFGFEGSVAATTVLVIGLFLTLALASRQGTGVRREQVTGNREQ
jgi:membrane protease YdiL (CAAX protease family)